MENKQIWNRLFKTDPKFTKPITGKTYKGTSPDPYYVISRMTDEFGPCGTGWGVEILDDKVVEVEQQKAGMHYCRISLWYLAGEKRGAVQAFGGTQLYYTSSQGKFIFDDDAPKKSMTDAMVKAASMIGMCGDIFMGLYDDAKYINGLKEEFSKKPEPQKLTQLQQAGLDAILTALRAKNKQQAQDHAAALSEEDWNVVWAAMPPAAQKAYSQTQEQK